MPINPSIPLQVRPPAPPQFGQARERIARLKDLMQRRDLRGLQIDQAEQQFSDQQTAREQDRALQSSFVIGPEGDFDPDATKVNIGESIRSGRISASFGMGHIAAIDERVQKQKMADTDRLIKDIDLRKAKAGEFGRIIAGATDQRTWTLARQKAISLGADPSELREEYSTDTLNDIRGFQKSLLTGDQILTQQRQEAESDRQRLTDEFTRFQNELEVGAQYGRTQPMRDLISTQVRPEIMEALPKEPEVLDALAMSPAQRATAERQGTADTLSREKFQEVKRHNLSMENREAGEDRVATRQRETRQNSTFQGLGREHDDLFSKENDLHAEMEAAGNELTMISSQIEEAEGDDVATRQLNSRRRTLEATISGNRSRIESLQKERADVQRRKDALYEDTAAPGQPAASGPRSGERRQHMGATYVFNGEVWERQ